VQAALLHDTVEDTDTTEAELREVFGNEVAGKCGLGIEVSLLNCYTLVRPHHIAQMQPDVLDVAWSVCLCLIQNRKSAETGELIEVPFGICTSSSSLTRSRLGPWRRSRVTTTNSLPPQSRNGNIVVTAAELVGPFGTWSTWWTFPCRVWGSTDR